MPMAHAQKKQALLQVWGEKASLGGVVRRSVHGPARRAILAAAIRPRDGWTHSKRSKREWRLVMVTGNPRLNVEGGEVDGSLLVLLFFGGKTVLEESPALSLVVLIYPQGHDKHQQPSHNKQKKVTMTTQGRLNLSFPQSNPPLPSRHTPRSTVLWDNQPGEYEREERTTTTTKKTKISAVSWVIRRQGPLLLLFLQPRPPSLLPLAPQDVLLYRTL